VGHFLRSLRSELSDGSRSVGTESQSMVWSTRCSSWLHSFPVTHRQKGFRGQKTSANCLGRLVSPRLEGLEPGRRPTATPRTDQDRYGVCGRPALISPRAVVAARTGHGAMHRRPALPRNPSHAEVRKETTETRLSSQQYSCRRGRRTVVPRPEGSDPSTPTAAETSRSKGGTPWTLNPSSFASTS
jgi:hypothetical protein